MQATLARKSQFPVFVLALALLGALMLGGMGGYLFRSLAARSTPTVLHAATAVGSAGPTSAIPAVDPLTGYVVGSADDHRILDLLKRSGYEGGATVVHGDSLGSERP